MPRPWLCTLVLLGSSLAQANFPCSSALEEAYPANFHVLRKALAQSDFSFVQLESRDVTILVVTHADPKKVARTVEEEQGWVRPEAQVGVGRPELHILDRLAIAYERAFNMFYPWSQSYNVLQSTVLLFSGSVLVLNPVLGAIVGDPSVMPFSSESFQQIGVGAGLVGLSIAPDPNAWLTTTARIRALGVKLKEFRDDLIADDRSLGIWIVRPGQLDEMVRAGEYSNFARVEVHVGVGEGEDQPAAVEFWEDVVLKLPSVLPMTQYFRGSKQVLVVSHDLPSRNARARIQQEQSVPDRPLLASADLITVASRGEVEDLIYDLNEGVFLTPSIPTIVTVDPDLASDLCRALESEGFQQFGDVAARAPE